MKDDRIQYADDDTSSIADLIKLRLPSVSIGLLLGIVLSFVTSRFEEALATDIRIAFFIPVVVYIAAAVGAQTQNIYARDLRTGKANFKQYLFKETIIGITLGALASVATAIVISLWFGSRELTTVVSLSMFISVTVAPLVALFVTEIVQLEHKDPAVGSGPIATVIQDTLSILIYGTIASAVIF